MMTFLHSDSAQSFWTGAGALWVFSAAISAMEPPRSAASSFYGWLYRFTHLLAANLDRAIRPIVTETHIQNEEKE